MSYIDKFHYARANPGKTDAYFVHDGMPIKIGTAMSQNTIEYPVPSTAVYSLFFFCPSAAHTETGTRYSGIFQTTSVASSLAITTSSLTSGSLSMITAYGGDMTTFSQDGFVWACRADISLVGPKAN